MFEQTRPASLAPWLVVAYVTHLVDECSTGRGLAEWATRVAGIPFSNDAWLLVNTISLAVFGGLAWAIFSKRLGALTLLLLAGHLFMHGTQHLAGALRFGEFSPGIVTGLVACLPASLLACKVALRSVSIGRAWIGFGVGAATFQPIWHMLFLVLE